MYLLTMEIMLFGMHKNTIVLQFDCFDGFTY